MNIARMNKAELFAEARRQGRSADDQATREELISLLNDNGGVKEDQFQSPDRLSGKKKTIMISSVEGPGGADHVPVSLNGKCWAIPRDKAIDVPVEVCEVLDNAVTTMIEPDGKNDDGSLRWKERHVRRFLVQYVQ